MVATDNLTSGSAGTTILEQAQNSWPGTRTALPGLLAGFMLVQGFLSMSQNGDMIGNWPKCRSPNAAFCMKATSLVSGVALPVRHIWTCEKYYTVYCATEYTTPTYSRLKVEIMEARIGKPNQPTNLMVPPEDMSSNSGIVGCREGNIH